MMPARSTEGSDRRRDARARVDALAPPFPLSCKLFCSAPHDKRAGGRPCFAEIVDVAPDGLLLRTTTAPADLAPSGTIELKIPGNPNTLWLWARTVRHVGDLRAVELVGTDLLDRACLAQLVRWRG